MQDENLMVIRADVQIPLSELRWRFTTSGGPGGQHANRSATRATLFFDVARSPSLPEQVRARLLQQLAPRLDKQGVLRIDVQDSRSQYQNRETAVLRLQTVLTNALHIPRKRRRTKPGRAARERRLQQKKAHSQRKKDRGWRY